MEELLAAGLHWRVLNFVVFVGLLVYFLRKPLLGFWVERAQQIRTDLLEADRLKRDSKERYVNLEKRFARIESEVSKFVHMMEEEGESEKKRMMEEAEKLAKRIQQDSERIAAQEVRKAREALKAEAVQISIELAERLIKENIRDEDQKKLSKEYLEGLETRS